MHSNEKYQDELRSRKFFISWPNFYLKEFTLLHFFSVCNIPFHHTLVPTYIFYMILLQKKKEKLRHISNKFIFISVPDFNNLHKIIYKIELAIRLINNFLINI